MYSSKAYDSRLAAPVVPYLTKPRQEEGGKHEAHTAPSHQWKGERVHLWTDRTPRVLNAFMSTDTTPKAVAANNSP